jgi:hypothetical protein
MKPDCGRNRKQQRRNNDGVRAADPVEQRNQHGATAGCADQVEEIDAIDAADRVRYYERENGSGKQERKRGDKIRENQFPARRRGTPQQKGQAQDDENGIEDGKHADFPVQRTAPACDDVRKYAAGAEPEEGNRNRQKREVIEIYNRKDAREGKLED